MNTDLTLDFAGGKFRFHLNDQQMWNLERGLGGPQSLPQPPLLIGPAYARLLRGRFIRDGEEIASPAHAEFSAVELSQIIRAGLIGGGGGDVGDEHISWDEYDVDSYMRCYVSPMPLVERWELALAIMGAAVEGITPPASDG
ncbi:hypothetical protein [Sphingomonas faeni]|uniref:hypothetical protein n=1 Tax=Sphingomonas faeni TaxID=185950 RepID=UPI0020BEC296|nr:hypothetical protein [Sphingomonas faeni]MCK8457033.1 hypothetical protein [Sphingomonas faeni]